MNMTPDEDRLEAIQHLREAFHAERKINRIQAKLIEELQAQMKASEELLALRASAPSREEVKASAWYVIHMILMLLVVAPLTGSFLAYHGVSWWWSGLLVPLMFWCVAAYIWNDHMRRRREEEVEKAEDETVGHP